MDSEEYQSLVIDIGSTRIKSAGMDLRGNCEIYKIISFPEMIFNDLHVEADPEQFYQAVLSVIPEKKNLLHLSITCQRSSFVIWDRYSSQTQIPIISWQDRRGEDFCNDHQFMNDQIYKQTGLMLSAHYMGPKLAVLFKNKPFLKKGLQDGNFLIGTLESYFLWRFSNKTLYITDITMASRTLLKNINERVWNEDLLMQFGVPHKNCLPQIVSSHINQPINSRYHLDYLLADQAAAFQTLIQKKKSNVLINLGTGVFVLMSMSNELRLEKGYLTAPVWFDQSPEYVIEGTINGGANVFNTNDELNHIKDEEHHFMRCFCVPDNSGWGSPFWQADKKMVFSDEAQLQNSNIKRIFILEGIAFRIRQIMDDFLKIKTMDQIYIAGGLSHGKYLMQSIATLLDRDIYQMKNAELTIQGMLYRINPLIQSQLESNEYKIVSPNIKMNYLLEKYIHWKKWVEAISH